MGRSVLNSSLSIVVFLVGAAMQSLPEQTSAGSAAESDAVATFLRGYLKGPDGVADETARYAAAFVHLDDTDRKQVIVHFTDQRSCGSGGCQTLILDPQESSFRVVTSLGIGWPPIRVLSTKTNGWHDLALRVRGGGVRPGYEARLQFNGNTYPRNPSIPPAEPLTRAVAGTVAIPASAEGTLLYKR